MKSADIILLQAFLNALGQLDKPLPVEIQNQLNEFGKSLTVNSTNIGKLDTIAQNYQPLYVAYQIELTSLLDTGAEKSRGIESLPSPEAPKQNTPEIINIARDVFSVQDSVAAVKKSKQPKNIFQRIVDLFTGNKSNVKSN